MNGLGSAGPMGRRISGLVAQKSTLAAPTATLNATWPIEESELSGVPSGTRVITGRSVWGLAALWQKFIRQRQCWRCRGKGELRVMTSAEAAAKKQSPFTECTECDGSGDYAGRRPRLFVNSQSDVCETWTGPMLYGPAGATAQSFYCRSCQLVHPVSRLT